MTTMTELAHVPQQPIQPVYDPALDFMPVMAIEQAQRRYNTILEFAKSVLRPGLDYGTIPRTERKSQDGTPNASNNTLLKPGAEKLCSLFGLVPDFEDYRIVEDWDKGFFYYGYKCNLRRNGRLVASGIGSCNSREKRYRRLSKVCPECGKPTLKRSKYPPRGKPKTDPGGWWCDNKKGGGCGADFDYADPRIAEQAGEVNADDACDLVNTIQKMAQKRAMVAATLIATSASEFFTQDVEDMDLIDVETSGPSAPKTQPAQAGDPAAQEWPAAAINDDPEPDLTDDVVYRRCYAQVLGTRSIKATEDEANRVLNGLLKGAKTPMVDADNNADLSKAPLGWRQGTLKNARDGKHDDWVTKHLRRAAQPAAAASAG